MRGSRLPSITLIAKIPADYARKRTPGLQSRWPECQAGHEKPAFLFTVKTKLTFLRLLLLGLACFAQRSLEAQTKLTYDVTGHIDVADLLIIRGADVQWHHPGSGAAVGRHSGANVATTITSTQDGVTNLNGFAWTPLWSSPPPAEIRFDAYSSVLSGLTPALPAGNVTVEASVLSGRGSVTIPQLPHATNDWTLIARFADGSAGSALITVRISVEFVPLSLVPRDAGSWQVQWPTNASSFQLESVASLPAAPGDWLAVTNVPVIQGASFTVPLAPTEPQRFFRLRKL